MLDDEKPEVEIVETPEKEADAASQIEIDLDAKTPPAKPEEKPSSDPVREKPFDYRKLNDAVAFQVRHQTKDLSKKLDDIVATLTALQKSATPQQAEAIQEEIDDYERIARDEKKGGWKKAVRMLAEEEAKRILQEAVQVKQSEESDRLRAQLVEKSRNFVLSQYPQLADESSDELKVFTQVWNENPTLWNNPEGHRLAMYEMEERIRAMGKTPKRVKYDVDKEVRRQLRANVSNVAGRNGSVSGNKYILTKEQQNVCDQLGIKYEEYAKTAKALENKEDISA